MSIVEMLIAVAIGGVLMIGVYTLLGRVMGAQKSMQLGGDIASTRDTLYFGMSCDTTITATKAKACKDAVKTYLPILGRNGQTLLAMNTANPEMGQTFGDWRLRASCSPTGMMVEAIRGKISGGKAPKLTGASDPLTGKISDWTNLFNGMNLCASNINAGGSPASGVAGAPSVHMEYLADGSFRPVNGPVKVTIKKIYGFFGGTDAHGLPVCKHTGLVNGKPIPDKYSFGLALGEQFKFAVNVVPNPPLGVAFGGTEDTTGVGMMLHQMGPDIWKLNVEDSFNSMNDQTWNDSIWLISSVPA